MSITPMLTTQTLYVLGCLGPLATKVSPIDKIIVGSAVFSISGIMYMELSDDTKKYMRYGGIAAAILGVSKFTYDVLRHQ